MPKGAWVRVVSGPNRAEKKVSEIENPAVTGLVEDGPAALEMGIEVHGVYFA